MGDLNARYRFFPVKPFHDFRSQADRFGDKSSRSPGRLCDARQYQSTSCQLCRSVVGRSAGAEDEQHDERKTKPSSHLYPRGRAAIALLEITTANDNRGRSTQALISINDLDAECSRRAILVLNPFGTSHALSAGLWFGKPGQRTHRNQCRAAMAAMRAVSLPIRA
jgi:hypothetical protein